MPLVVLGEYLPDQPDIGNPGLLMAKNARPLARGYRPFPGWQSLFSSALSGYVRGGAAGRDANNNTFNVAGTYTTLEMTRASTLDDVSRTSGGAYTLGSEDYWEFAKFGQHLFATSYADPVQYFDLGGSTDFVDNTFLIPDCRTIAVVRDQLFVGNLNDSLNPAPIGDVPEAIAFGPLGAPAQTWPEWGTSAARGVQADYQIIPSGGPVKRILEVREMAMIFLERQLWRGDFVGGSVFWDFSPVDQNQGCLAPGSAVAAGPRAFYLAEDGFRMTDGVVSVPIGEEKINHTFFADVDLNYPNSISAEVSPRDPEVLWIYPGTGHTAGKPNKWVLYNWVLNRWSHGEADLERVVRTLPPGFSMDELDTAIGPNLDADPPYTESLDSSFYVGFPWDLGAYDHNHELGTFIGDPPEVIFETGDFEVTPNRRSFVSGVRPVAGDCTIYVSLSAKAVPSSPVAFGAERLPTAATGQCDFRSDARYHRAKLRIPTPVSTDEFVGMDFNARASGDR